jgi:hypothetical protein
MERPQICAGRYYAPNPNKDTLRVQTQGNIHVNYSKPQNYGGSPLCQPHKDRIFMKDQEPKYDITQDMCRLNNECKDDGGYTYLNQRGVKPSPFFDKVQGEFYPTDYKSRKTDARLVDSVRDYTQELDTKPIQVHYNLINDNISGNPELKNYGKNYTSYANVSGGQIQYYIDKELADPFHKPVYATKTNAVGYTFKDPMDSVKPQFEKQVANFSFTGLSWLDDSGSFRDDIIAKQQRTHNEQRYEYVYNRM